jgi:hypothetical protein
VRSRTNRVNLRPRSALQIRRMRRFCPQCPEPQGRENRFFNGTGSSANLTQICKRLRRSRSGNFAGPCTHRASAAAQDRSMLHQNSRCKFAACAAVIDGLRKFPAPCCDISPVGERSVRVPWQPSAYRTNVRKLRAFCQSGLGRQSLPHYASRRWEGCDRTVRHRKSCACAGFDRAHARDFGV